MHFLKVINWIFLGITIVTVLGYVVFDLPSGQEPLVDLCSISLNCCTNPNIECTSEGLSCTLESPACADVGKRFTETLVVLWLPLFLFIALLNGIHLIKRKKQEKHNQTN
jgi:hypothetical protein